MASDSVQPGELPEKPLGIDIMEAAFKAQGGARVRPTTGMGDKAMLAGIDRLFERAAKGDPAAVYKSHDESWGSAKARHDQAQQ